MSFFEKNKVLKILGIAVIVLVLFLIVGKKQGWIGKGNITKVSTDTVTRKTIIETVSASGKIYPEIEVKISPDVSGEIIQLNIKEGDTVKEGQVLAKINPDIYHSMTDRAVAALNNVKANLANSQARFAQVNAQFESAKNTFERNKKLYNDKVISSAEYENAETNFKSAKAEVDAAQQNVIGAQYSVKSAEASVKEARDNLNKTTIYAPMNGIVSQLNIEKGERVVGTSQMAGTEMMRIANMNNMEARVDVGENDVLRVSVYDTAIIEIDAYPGREFKGVVTQIANSSSSANQLGTEQVTNFTVDIRLLKDSYTDLTEAKNKNPFRPGMTAMVNIQTKKAKDVIVVPIQSVTTREENKSFKDKLKKRKSAIKEIVFVYNNGKVKSTEVTTGIQDDEFIEIKKGLETGKEVVTAPYPAISKKLKDGSKVQKVKREDLFETEKEEVTEEEEDE